MTATNNKVDANQTASRRHSPVCGSVVHTSPDTGPTDPAGSDSQPQATTVDDSDGQPQLAHMIEENIHLRAKLTSLPVIEQAKGLLMGRYHLDADTAFALLRRWSSHTNIKLRDLCRLLVDAAAQPTPTPPPTGPASGQRSALEQVLAALHSGRQPASDRTAGGHHAESSTPTVNSMLVADLSTATDHDLLTELATIEQAIARATAFHHTVDEDGRGRIRVSHDLLAWADREHQLATELRRRHHMPITSRVTLPTEGAGRTVSIAAGAA